MTLQKFVQTSASRIYLVRWIKIWRLFSAPVVVFVLFNTSAWWLKCDFRFFRITIIRLIVSCSYCWTSIKIWLIIFLATGKSGELFRGTYFFRTRSLFSATVICFWSIIIHFFFFTLSIAFNSASIIWNVTPIASTMTMKTEFVGGPTVLRC